METINNLLQRMTKESSHWESSGDRRHVFLQCYTLMSRNMYVSIEEKHFSDPLWVSTLLVRFSDYYFEALDLYQSEHPHVPSVWKQAHDASKNPEPHVLQNLLLGVNAHINYDLPLTLYDCMEQEWISADPDKRTKRKNDHELVNQVIANSIDAVQDNIIKPLSPSLAFLDKLMGRMDEWLLSKMIVSWRSDVWNVSQLLLEAKSPDVREEIRQRQELQVLKRGEQLFNLF
ncbi:DUF5995 family protein [Cecembia calidifontis]|uniref:Uncharacterized protein n=1 Tax=Cecembia calidifontis TaxID=1187080 RepID=A0A4Q7P733_9BACT|nr:DUF5995 family protein [Cecembia calidifontis]RZS95926.1 hypothetical protein BC751_1479 [Cecembia calidifontis]